MGEWKINSITYFSGASIQSDKLGQTPQRPKYLKNFVNIETGEFNSVTDLDSKKYKRNKHFNDFARKYQHLYKSKMVSILGIIVNQDEYESISKFMNTISRKLKRKGIDKLGYVWARDIGDIKFEKHYHVLISTDRINADVFKSLFSKKKNQNYEVSFMKSKNGLVEYIKEKELYGKKRQKSYGKSRKFNLPSIYTSKLKSVITN